MTPPHDAKESTASKKAETANYSHAPRTDRKQKKASTNTDPPPPSETTTSNSPSQSTDSKKAPLKMTSKVKTSWIYARENATTEDPPTKKMNICPTAAAPVKKRRQFSARWERWRSPSSIMTIWSPPSTAGQASLLQNLPNTQKTSMNLRRNSTPEWKTSIKSTPKLNKFCHVFLKIKKILQNISNNRAIPAPAIWGKAACHRSWSKKQATIRILHFLATKSEKSLNLRNHIRAISIRDQTWYKNTTSSISLQNNPKNFPKLLLFRIKNQAQSQL